MSPAHRARSRRRIAAGLAILAAGAVTLVVSNQLRSSQPTPDCRAVVAPTSYALDSEQAADATTVAAVGKRLGLPDHAVTVALAAALQESDLHDLTHGDLDSVGIFQQRPSQGWGTRSQILVPRYAAAAFYRRLVEVPGWQQMAVTDAAQAVQRSAAPDAYAAREPEARLLAIALTGEAPAGLSCHFDAAEGPSPADALRQAMSAELGAPTLGVNLSPARGWTVASWLVAHAEQFRLSALTFDGLRWTPSRLGWTPAPVVAPRVTVTAALAPRARSG